MNAKYPSNTFLQQALCLDFESTELEPDNAEIIETGFSHLVENVLTTDDALHNCNVETIAPEVSAINNITKNMLEGHSVFSWDKSHVNSHIVGTVEAHGDFLLASHNAVYDMQLLAKYVPTDIMNMMKDRWLCTMRMARKLYVNDVTFKEFNLAYLQYRLELAPRPDDITGQPHRAGYDSHITFLLLKHIVEQLEQKGVLSKSDDYFAKIQEWLATPVKIEKMPFGKHQGEPLEDVPKSYWIWAIKNVSLFNEDSPDYDMDLTMSALPIIEDKLDLS